MEQPILMLCMAFIRHARGVCAWGRTRELRATFYYDQRQWIRAALYWWVAFFVLLYAIGLLILVLPVVGVGWCFDKLSGRDASRDSAHREP